MKPRLPFIWVSLAGLLALVLLLGTADTARADFNPELEVTLIDPEAGANSNFTTQFNLPKGDVNFGGLVVFIPPEWEITPGDDIPIGAIVGDLSATVTLGLINGACDNVVIVEFTFLNSSTDPTDTVPWEDTDDNDDEDWFEDKDNSGLQDAFEKYPDFITRVLTDENDEPLTPIRRAAGIQIVAGANVLLQFLVFEPGTFIDEDIPYDEELGYPTVTLLQNAGDEEAAAEPGPITDFCTSLVSTNNTFGVTRDNNCTAGVTIDELDPICEVTSALLLECDDSGDNDGDQTANDGCPTIGDEAETACEDQEDDDNDGWVNDGCPAVEEAEHSTPMDLHRNPLAAAESGPDEGGQVLFTNPTEEGTYTFTVIGAGLRDADGDGYENSLDVCPFDPNVGEPRMRGAGDLDEDGLDAACDPDDSNTNSDQDLDGYLNRQDNCPLDANGEDQDNQRDTDTDQVGDACDPNPDDDDAQGELILRENTFDLTIGAGGPPDGEETPADGEEDDGGGAAVVIIIVVIVAVVIVGGGAFFLMRRRGA